MLVAMSRMIWKPNFAVQLNTVHLNAVCWNAVRLNAVRLNAVRLNAVRMNAILPLLILAMPLCLPSLSVAQQNDRSVLVFEDSSGSAGSNAQVEIETDSAHASDSASTFQPIQASTQLFLPPSPPTGMIADSDSAAGFRRPNQRTLTAVSPKIETPLSVAPLRPSHDNAEPAQATSATLLSSDSGTFASRLPNDSGLQVDNSFGSSRAPSDLRSSSANSTPRNRFGDFGAPPSSGLKSRFASLPSNSSGETKPTETARPTQPPINRSPQPPVVSASEQQRLQPKPTNRFGVPATPPSNRFAQPSSPKAVAPPTSRPSAPPITTRPNPALQNSSRTNITQPQASSQSVFSLNDNSSSSNSLQPRPTQPSSLKSSSFGDSSLRPSNNSSSRSISSSGAGFPSNSSSRPMLRRQPSSSSPSSFSNSSSAGQSNTGSSRSAPQTSRFASQSDQQPFRGNTINNDLRSNSSNNQRSPIQRPTQSTNRNQLSGGQSNGKADRESINFAKQQLRNIQPASADANGTPVRLQEMLQEPLTGSQRKLMVAQYWETYYDLAALKIATDYAGWLNSISTSGSEQGLLSAAQRMASDQKLAAKIQLGKSQSRLMDFMPNPRPTGFSPLPADEPLVEHYVTDYEKYKRVRTLPSSLRGIDPMLASTLKLITQRAETVSMAKDAADQASRNRQTPLASAISTGQLWRDSQLDMVASTISYNQAISDFVLTLEPNRSPEQLTAFMLGTPKNNSQPSFTNPQNQSTRNATNQNQQGFPTNRQHFR